jgi:uncharacterized protein (DUF433 family)
MTLDLSLLSRITQTPGQCSGRPCIRGMRIRVSDILEMLAENVSMQEIIEDFPDLELEDIQACLLFAARRTEFLHQKPTTKPVETKLSLQQIAALPLSDRHRILAQSIPATAADFLSDPELTEFSDLDHDETTP